MSLPDQTRRIQAWVDGELHGADAREVETLLTADPAARALAEFLQALRRRLAAGELERPVPETREFYWSKIARGIAASAPAERRRVEVPWWRRLLVPAGALTVLALSLLVLRTSPGVGASGHFLGERLEIEDVLEDMSSFTFRSEAAQMTVVWVDMHVH